MPQRAETARDVGRGEPKSLCQQDAHGLAESQFDSHTIERDLAACKRVSVSPEHVGRHVREDDAFGANQWELFAKRRKSEVEGNRTFERVSLGDEQIRGARSIEEFVGPLRVAGVSDDATIALDVAGRLGVRLPDFCRT